MKVTDLRSWADVTQSPIMPSQLEHLSTTHCGTSLIPMNALKK